MDQTHSILTIIKDHNMQGAKGVNLPYPMDGEPLSKADNATDAEKDACSKFEYRKLVGQIMYIMIHTRPDVMYALNILSR